MTTTDAAAPAAPRKPRSDKGTKVGLTRLSVDELVARKKIVTAHLDAINAEVDRRKAALAAL